MNSGSADGIMLVILGFILFFLSTLAESVVRVLCYQIEESSNGYIRSNVMLYTLACAVALFVAITIAKIIYGIPFFILDYSRLFIGPFFIMDL